MAHTITTTYAYRQGRYDAPTKEFRGFGRVEVRDAEGTVSITEFHQDELLKGRPSLQELRDASGNLWTKTEPAWSAIDPYPGVHFVQLDQTEASTCDGDDICGPPGVGSSTTPSAT